MEKSAIDKILMPGYGEGYSDGIRDGSEAGIKIAQDAYVNSVRPIHMTCPQNHCPIYKQIRMKAIAEVKKWLDDTESLYWTEIGRAEMCVTTDELYEKLDSMADKGDKL